MTIEHREDIDSELAESLGDWMFGCDICQEVCPWNRRAAIAPQAIPQPFQSLAPADLIEILQLDDAAFRERYRYTPLWRSKRRGVIRNACLVLGNQKCLSARPALEKLLSDPEPLIRGAAQWAVEKLQ